MVLVATEVIAVVLPDKETVVASSDVNSAGVGVVVDPVDGTNVLCSILKDTLTVEEEMVVDETILVISSDVDATVVVVITLASDVKSVNGTPSLVWNEVAPLLGNNAVVVTVVVLVASDVERFVIILVIEMTGVLASGVEASDVLAVLNVGIEEDDDTSILDIGSLVTSSLAVNVSGVVVIGIVLVRDGVSVENSVVLSDVAYSVVD